MSQDYERETYTLEDLLNKSNTQEPYSVMKYVDVKETRSMVLGKCFTLSISKAVYLGELLVLTFKRSWDVTIFVHNDGEEFWFPWSPYIPLLKRFHLNIKTNNDTFATEVQFTEKHSQFYPKGSMPCKAPTSDDSRESILKEAADYR